jgi:hypothetical protein
MYFIHVNLNLEVKKKNLNETNVNLAQSAFISKPIQQ